MGGLLHGRGHRGARRVGGFFVFFCFFFARYGFYPIDKLNGLVFVSTGRLEAGVASFDTIKKWWDTVSDAYLDVPEDESALLQPGCTRNVSEFFAHVWGQVRSIHWFPYDRVGEVDADP